jgi:hypothetical protein
MRNTKYPKRCLSEEEDPIHILLKCSETRKWREQFLGRKWLRLKSMDSFQEKKLIAPIVYRIKKYRKLPSSFCGSTVL